MYNVTSRHIQIFSLIIYLAGVSTILSTDHQLFHWPCWLVIFLVLVF